jgi:ABC-type Fe3+-siderophore transport system permease subunit
MLTSELLLQLLGFIGAAVIFYVVYSYPTLYNNPTLEIPYLGVSALLLIGVIFGFVIPIASSLILYNRMRKIQRILTFMNRAKERLNIMSGKITQAQVDTSNSLDGIQKMIQILRDKANEIERIKFVRW